MKVIRTTLVLTALTLLLITLGGYFGGRQGMTIALGFAVVFNGFAYFFSDKIALWSSGAQPVSREQAPRRESESPRPQAVRRAAGRSKRFRHRQESAPRFCRRHRRPFAIDERRGA